MRKKILKEVIIVNDYSYREGGASVVALTSALELTKVGFSVTLFSCVGNGIVDSNKSYNEYFLNQKDIRNEFSRIKAAVQGIINIEAKRRLETFLKSKSPDNSIVHFHTWSKAISPATINIPAKLGFKTIITAHDYFLACPNGGFADFRKMTICHRKPLGISCLICNCDSRKYSHKIWRFLRTFLMKNVFRVLDSVNAIIFVSKFSLDILLPYINKNILVFTLRNPIPLKKADIINVSKNDTFLFVGRLSAEKGVLLFSRAAKKTNIHAVFVGDGPLNKSIKEINDNVIITGWLQQDDVVNWFRKARALVFPSCWYEAQALVLGEAMAQGIPIIASDVTVAKEYIRHEENSLLFCNNNVHDLESKICELKNGEYANKLGHQLYEDYWTNPWSLEHHINGLIDIYNKVLNS